MRLSLVSLAALTAALAAAPAFAQTQGHDHGGHGHEHVDDHGHDHGDHGQDHGDVEEHHPSGLRLDVEAVGAIAPGEPVTLSLQLSGPDGTPVTAADLVETHGRLLHVLIVDEGLEDYHQLHPQPGEDGAVSITFTPQHPRIYRVWAHAALAEPFETPVTAGDGAGEDQGHDHSDHDHGDHDHGDHGHGDDHEGQSEAGHAAHADGAVRASDWIRIGDEAAPFILPVNELEASAGGLRFTLTPEAPIRMGEAAAMTVSVADADGAPVTALEPYRGAFAHMVGFNSGASNMAHAHALGAEPSSDQERAGPDLAFEVGFEQAGVHRLFVQVRHDGEVLLAPFTVVVED